MVRIILNYFVCVLFVLFMGVGPFGFVWFRGCLRGSVTCFSLTVKRMLP